MKKIVLYNPNPSEEKEYGRVPLSLLAISRYLHKEDYDIVIIEYFEKNVLEKVLETVKGSICIGITCMTGYQLKDAVKIAKLVKEKNPEVPIVWGGWHASILPEETLKSKYADYVVRGQGEISFTELVHALSEKKPVAGILGVSYKLNGELFTNPDRPMEDLNNFPEIPYGLVDVKKQITCTEFGKKTINYYSSQGCPYRCAFCADSNVYKRRWSILKPERIVAELKHLRDTYGIDSVILADSNFFINEKHTQEFCKLHIAENLNVKLGLVDGRSNILARYSDETWTLMKKAGFMSILNGTESGSQEILDFIQKDATVDDTRKLSEKCRRFEMTLVCSTMIGLPGKNTAAEYASNIKLLDELLKINKHISCYMFIYTPYPGSPLYHAAIKQGFHPPNTLEGWSNFDLHKLNTPWVHKKYISRVKQLSAYYFPFLGDQNWNIVNNYSGLNRFAAKIMYYIFSTFVKIRWKLKWFSIPVDYHLYIGILRFRNRFLS